MTKSELIAKLSESFPHLLARDAEKIVDAMFNEMIDALSKGNRIEIRGFGAFSVKKKGSHIGRNPRTGEQISVDQRYSPCFKIGKELHQRINKNL